MTAVIRVIAIQFMIQRLLFAATIGLMALPFMGCGVYRDDTTSATRQLVAEQLGVEYGIVKANATLNDLNCDDLDIVEIIMTLEESFDITIADSEFESLAGERDWNELTILEIANLVRAKRSF